MRKKILFTFLYHTLPFCTHGESTVYVVPYRQDGRRPRPSPLYVVTIRKVIKQEGSELTWRVDIIFTEIPIQTPDISSLMVYLLVRYLC